MSTRATRQIEAAIRHAKWAFGHRCACDCGYRSTETTPLIGAHIFDRGIIQYRDIAACQFNIVPLHPELDQVLTKIVNCEKRYETIWQLANSSGVWKLTMRLSMLKNHWKHGCDCFTSIDLRVRKWNRKQIPPSREQIPSSREQKKSLSTRT